MRKIGKFLSGAALALVGGIELAHAEPVVMISIDGLRPADIIDAEARGVTAPNLRAMMRNGAYAREVIGVMPTLTYPSHTTLITGVAPARHGVTNNRTFDPLGINQGGWYWYAEDIAVPTLWDAARARGLKTLNVHWPVSVGADIDHNLPQIWRGGHDDDRKLVRALAVPKGALATLEHEHGPYAQGIDESVEGDENRARFAVSMIARDHPDFTTIYLAGLDHIEHLNGPGSPEAKAAITRLDALVGEIAATARRIAPDTTVVVVSDHGFLPVHTDINLAAALEAAGLIRRDAAGKVTSWDANVWPMGGSTAIILARPDDNALKAKVAHILAQQATDPKMGIAQIWDQRQIAAAGAAPQAQFMVIFADGFESAGDVRTPLVAPSHYKGMHGYAPANPAMVSSLFVDGARVAHRGDLGTIDMRAIAPAVAAHLGVKLGADADQRQAQMRPVF